MQETVQKVSRIPILLPEKEIYSRLGYNIHKTIVEPAQQKTIKLEMQKAFAMCCPQGVWRIVSILKKTEKSLTLSGNITIESSDIARLYGDCRALWIAGATIGATLPNYVAKNLAESNNSVGLIGDATGSESADAAMDFLQRSADLQLRKSGSGLTKRRFSPGYGDWSLEGQRAIFALLDLENTLQITLRETLIMSPEKSVTAVAGVL